MAVVKLPKNISEVEYKTAGGKVRKYQVRMQIKGEKINRLFDTVSEADAFAKACRAGGGAPQPIPPTTAPTASSPTPSPEPQGRPSLLRFAKNPSGDPTIDRDPALRQQFLDNMFKKGAPLSYYLDKYFQQYYAIPDGQKEKVEWRKLKQSLSLESYIRTLKNTEIRFVDPTLAKLMPGGQEHENLPLVPLGKIFIPDLTHIAINHYIKARKDAGRKDATILKEISVLKGALNSLKHLGYGQWQTLINPVDHYDRRLLSLPAKSAQRISPDELDRIKAQLWGCSNPEVELIFWLAYHTAMRKGEVINLRHDQLNAAGYVELTYKDTKTKTARKVYLTDTAQQLIEYILAQKFHPTKLFKITESNFSQWWMRLSHNGQFKHVNFHCVRKEAISQLVIALDSKNPLIVGTFVGACNLTTFAGEYLDDDPSIDTLAGVLKSVGHRKVQTTGKHYFDFGHWRPTFFKPPQP
jgi:integrase